MLNLSYGWLAIAADVSAKTLLLAALAGFALTMLRVRDANVRHRVWTAVLAGMLVMPLLVLPLRNVMPSVPLPGWMTVAWPLPGDGGVQAVSLNSDDIATVEPHQANVAHLTGSLNAFPHEHSLGNQQADDAQRTDVLTSARTSSATHPAGEHVRGAIQPYGRSWFALTWPISLAVVYFAIALTLVLRWSVGLISVCRLVRQSRCVNREMTLPVKDKTRLLEHPSVYVPLTVGYFRPVVLLPADWRAWNPNKLQAVLDHELAHVRRADWIVTLLAELNGAIYWFHPLAWFLKRTLAGLAERCCDDAVLEAQNDRVAYARYLLEVAASLTARNARHHAPLQSVAMARIPSVETRIDAILDTRRPLARRLGSLGATILPGIGIPAVLLAAAIQPGSETAESPSPSATNQRDSEDVSERNDRVQPDGELRHVRGQVLGPGGEPLAAARVVATSVLMAGSPGYPRFHHHELGQTVSDEQGYFELKFSLDYDGRSESESRFKLAFRDWRPSHTGWQILAYAEGYGPAWAHGQQVKENDSTLLQLTEDAPIEGRVVDLEGNPISGVSVRLRELQPSRGEPAILDWIKQSGERLQPAALQDYFFRSDDRYPSFFPRNPDDGGLVSGSPALPATTATDRQGRFSFAGLPTNCMAILEVEGPKIAKSILHVVTREMEPVSARKLIAIGVHTPVHYGRKFEFVAEPSQPIEGTVTDAETGKPLANILVQVQRFSKNRFSQDGFLETRTDEAGRYRLDGAPQGGGHVIGVKPEVDEPYFETELDVPPATTFEPISCDFALRKGVWIRGRVTEHGTREPIAGATVHYLPLRSNVHAEDYADYDPRISGRVPDERFRTSDDGSFRVLAIPGAGVLATIAQNEDATRYVATAANDLPAQLVDENGGLNAYHPWAISGYHALDVVEIPETAADIEHSLQLMRGLSRRINLVDPDGQPIEGVRLLGRTFPPSLEYSPLESPKVEIVGLRPDGDRFVVFIHSDRKVGKALTITAGDETTVQLEPCAVAKGRVIDGDGLPVRGVEISVAADRSDGWGRRLDGDTTGEDGRFEVLLPPGAPLRVWHYSRQKGRNFTADCDPKPDDVIDLGDLTDGMKLDADETARRTVARRAG